MNEELLKSMIFDLEEEVEKEIRENLTLEEKLAIEIIAVEKRFYYSSESVQRKREIKEILDRGLRKS